MFSPHAHARVRTDTRACSHARTNVGTLLPKTLAELGIDLNTLSVPEAWWRIYIYIYIYVWFCVTSEIESKNHLFIQLPIELRMISYNFL